MQISRWDEKYRDDVVGLVDEFCDSSLNEYVGPSHRASVMASIDQYKDGAYLLLSDGRCIGVMAGFGIPVPTTGEWVWQEVIWYVSKRHRGGGYRFLRTVMQMLKDSGYSKIIMACMHNSMRVKVDRLYTLLGFVPTETHYVRGL